MGGSFADGLLKGTLFRPEDITVANPHEEKLLRFKEAGHTSPPITVRP